MTREEIFAAYFKPMGSERRVASDEEIAEFFKRTSGLDRSTGLLGLLPPSPVKITPIEGATTPEWLLWTTMEMIAVDSPDDLYDEVQEHFERFWNGRPDAQWVITGFSVNSFFTDTDEVVIVCQPNDTSRLFCDYDFGTEEDLESRAYWGMLSVEHDCDSIILFEFANNRAYLLEIRVFGECQRILRITEIIEGEKTCAVSACYIYEFGTFEKLEWELTEFYPLDADDKQTTLRR